MSICKKYDCLKCPSYQKCGGCEANKGKPFGKLCISASILLEKGLDEYIKTEEKIIHEINSLEIDFLTVDRLNILPGDYVNLEYPMPNGKTSKFLDDNKTYFGNQIKIPASDDCYGVVSDGSFLLVARYGEQGKNPELIIYKKI